MVKLVQDEWVVEKNISDDRHAGIGINCQGCPDCLVVSLFGKSTSSVKNVNAQSGVVIFKYPLLNFVGFKHFSQ